MRAQSTDKRSEQNKERNSERKRETNYVSFLFSHQNENQEENTWRKHAFFTNLDKCFASERILRIRQDRQMMFFPSHLCSKREYALAMHALSFTFSHHIASHASILSNKGCFSVTKNIHPLVTEKTSGCKRLAILAAGHFPKKSYRHKVENFF